MVLLQCLQEEHGVWLHNPRAREKRTFKIKTRRRGVCVKVLVVQLCLTLCFPMDYNPPDSSVHGILQEKILTG